jgi:preprotein translocase subunit YajC
MLGMWWMAPPAGKGGGTGALVSFLPLILIFFIFYLLVFRPQQKRQRDHQSMLSALKKGDRVLTTGGLYGTIIGIKNNVAVLKIAENVKVEVQRSAIAGVVAAGEGYETDAGS